MSLSFQLHITPTLAGQSHNWSGASALGRICGGRTSLLDWLEIQLGCAKLPVPMGRELAYRAVLEQLAASGEWGSTGQDGLTRSFSIDPLGTAATLLAHRDELLLCGWNGKDAPTELLVVLARVETICRRDGVSIDGSEAERLLHVEQLLDEGRLLPSYTLLVEAPAFQWPHRWRKLLARLRPETSESAAAPTDSDRAARPDSALVHVQASFQGLLKDSQPELSVLPDESLQWWRAASASAACESVADILDRAATNDPAPRIAVLCEEPSLARQLDGALERRGAPTLGVAIDRAPLPALQVLPLALELGWDPLDPQVLLDFLTLPLTPLTPSLARRLARAIGEAPGIGSDSWEAELTSCEEVALETDPDTDVAWIRNQVRDWIDSPRHDRTAGLDRQWITRRALQVSRWGTRQAAKFRDSDPERSRSLAAAARQAELLCQLIDEDWIASGERVSEPLLARLLDAVSRSSSVSHPRVRLAGSARWVRGLSELVGDAAQFDHLIWLGTSARDSHRSRWCTTDLRDMQAGGIDIDDGQRALKTVRASELRAWGGIRRSVVAIEIPSDHDHRPHPLWLRVRQSLTRTLDDGSIFPVEPRSLEHALHESALAAPAHRENAAAASTKAFVRSHDVTHEPPRRSPTVWHVDPTLLHDRERSSSTSLDRRLKCPLAWTLNYIAKVRKSEAVRVNLDNRLKGTFCHHVLERVLPTADLSDVDAVVSRVETVFDERVAKEAAPLAQTTATADRARLRKDLAHATRTLVAVLARGGYRIVAMEKECTRPFEDRELQGFIDCLVIDEHGHEAVVDFKYTSWASGYRTHIKDGTALQLATYGALRQTAADGARFPRVAYLMLMTGELMTPDGSPLLGAGETDIVSGAPAMAEVWAEFTRTLRGAEGWLQSGDIPVRPRQAASDWPPGIDRIIHPSNPPKEVCRFCDYKMLCGLEEAR